MSLDLFQTDNRDAIASAGRDSAPLLPATFKESFDAAWDNAVLFGQSFPLINARNRAMDSLYQQAYDATRDERFRQDTVQFGNRFRGPDGGHSRKTKLQVYNDIVAEHLAEQPERETSGFPPSDVRPVSAEELDTHATEISKDARDAYKAMAARQGGGLGTLAGTAAGTLVDPINVLTFPLAAPEALGILKTGLAWAGIGAGTQTAIEALGAPYREKVEPGYAASSEPGANILEAGVFAGTLGSTIKALGVGWRYYKGRTDIPRTIRDAGNVVESEAQIAETNPFRGPEGETAHRDALVKTFDDVVAGRPVDVERIVTPEMMDGYGSRLVPILKARQAAIDAGERAAFLAREDARLPPTMERLSELQLSEIRGAVDALDTGLTARVTDLTEGVAKARAAVEQQTATVEKLRTDAAAAPDNAKLATRLTKAEAKLETLSARAEKRAGELPMRQLTAEARTATRNGPRTTELTKAISKLADDGYGVKLDPAEAASLAEHILKAPPDGVEAALRDTTEHLVDKARAQRALAPPVPFGMPRPHEEQAAHALRITNVMRSRIQTLAREGGYAMPREEAGAIAARLLSVKEPDARAILDELVLRPRTLAKTLAEPPPVVPEGIPTPPTAAAPPAPAVGGAAALPPPAPDTVRFFHGGPPDTPAAGQPTAGGGRWTTPDYVYARDYRSEGGRPGDVWYVDIPKGDPTEVKARMWDEQTDVGTNMVGRYSSIEVPEQWAKQMKPVPAETPAREVSRRGARPAPHPDAAEFGFALNPDRVAPEGPSVVSRTEFRPFGTEQVGQKTVSVNGEMVASADVIRKNDGNLQIQKIETLPAAQRKGYATELVRDLQEEFPDAQITTSMRTDQGSAFFRALGSDRGSVPVPREAATLPPVPGWLQHVRQEAVDFANKIGVTDQIQRMAAEGKTAAQISTALGERLSVDEVRAVRDSLGIAPAGPQAGIGLGVMPAYERAAAEQLTPENVAKLRADPEMTATIDRDLQRMRAETPDKEIPIGVDKNGNTITRTVEETATDIEQRQKLAEEIRLSCGPQPPESDSGGQ